MSTVLNPYLSFRDDASEAIDFYQSVFGGEVVKSRFGEFDMGQDPSENDKIMHAVLSTPSGFTLMAADSPASMPHNPGDAFSVSLSGDDEAELRGYWDKLSADGTVIMPLEKAPWGDSFGMCRDRFGVGWMVNIAGSPAS